MGVLRAAVVEDDRWKRFAMATKLHALDEVEVTHAVDQHEAARWTEAQWSDIDVAIIDVFDDHAPGQVGTDLYSGLAAVERLASAPVHVMAILPHTPHPLVQRRVLEAAPDCVYNRWELPTLEVLRDAILDRVAGPQPSPPPDLRAFGVSPNARLNAVVRLYLESPLAGALRLDLKLAELGVPRDRVDRFRVSVGGLGFIGTEDRHAVTRAVRGPRWPDTRDFLLRLLGRLDAPPTEHDRPWLL